MNTDGVEFIKIDASSKEDYYKILDILSDFNTDSLTVKCTSRKKPEIIIENDEDLKDDEDSDIIDDSMEEISE